MSDSNFAPLLEQKLLRLRETREYRDILELVATACRQVGGSSERVLATAADTIVRPIVSDLSVGTPSRIVILHMGVVAR
jgi:hypothetical protein